MSDETARLIHELGDAIDRHHRTRGADDLRGDVLAFLQASYGKLLRDFTASELREAIHSVDHDTFDQVVAAVVVSEARQLGSGFERRPPKNDRKGRKR